MKTSLKGVLAMIEEEALVLSSYRDKVGVWTIGVGHTAMAGNLKPAPGVKIGIEEAIKLFASDLEKYEWGVSKAIRRPLSQNQFDALVSFHFNTGAVATGTVDDLINAGQMVAAMNKLEQYNRGKGKVIDGLTTRRARERAMFEKGTYPNIDHIRVWDKYPGKSKRVPVSEIDLKWAQAAPQAPIAPPAPDVPGPTIVIRTQTPVPPADSTQPQGRGLLWALVRLVMGILAVIRGKQQ